MAKSEHKTKSKSFFCFNF